MNPITERIENTALRGIPLYRALFALCVFVVLFPAVSLSAPWSRANASHNINFNTDGSDPSKYFGKWPGHAYFPSPQDWREISVYHLLTDRFRDGDPTNNDGQYGGYDVSNLHMRQGGDFRGIADKLDYIQSLGFDAIWISPIFQNGANEYHGYGQLDYTLIDDRFGTLADLRHLVDEAHKRKMYVIVDIVVNHMGDLLRAQGYEQEYTPFKFHTGEYDLAYRDPSRTYADFNMVNNFIQEGSYPSVYNQKGELVQDKGQGSYWESDFHHNGGLTDYQDPWNIHLGKIYDKYDDLRTTHERVQKKIAAMTKALLSSVDIDGIRMDTPMQVPVAFFESWLPEVREHAKKLGKENFFFFAETYCTEEVAATLLGRGRNSKQYGKDEYLRDVSLFDGGIDYLIYKGVYEPLFFHSIANPLKWIVQTYEREFLKYDFFHEETQQSRYRNLHFFGSHDQRRIGILKDGDRKLKLAASLMAAWPGIPVFYYGDEQGFNSYGSGIDGHAREPMMHSIAWQNHPAAQTPNIASRDNFNMTSEPYLFVQKAMQVRKRYAVLQKGEVLKGLYERSLKEGYVLVLERSLAGTKEKVLIVLNTSLEKHSFTVNAEGATVWKDTLSEVEFRSDDKGSLAIDIEPLSSFLLVPLEQYVADTTMILRQITPAHDEFVLLNESTPAITFSFSEPVDELSLKNRLFLNKKPVRTGDLTILQDGKEFSFPAPKSPGVYEFEVLNGVVSREGRMLPYHFSSRFVLASEELAPFYSGVETFHASGSVTQSPLLFENSLRLTHPEIGSSFYRIYHDRSWSEWTRSVRTSDITFKGTGWKDFTIQYWIDGSAAYFIRGGVDAYGYDGFGVNWLKSKSIQKQFRVIP